MASSKPHASSSAASSPSSSYSAASCEVQVLDSYEPPALTSSRVSASPVQVLDSDEPLVLASAASCVVQVSDSYEPLALTSSRVSASPVQVLDSDEPLVLASAASCEVQVLDSYEPLALTSPRETSTVAADPLASCSQEPAPCSSDEETNRHPAGSTDSTGVRMASAEEIRSLWNFGRLIKKLGTEEQCIQFAEDRGLIPREKMCIYHKKPMTLSGRYGLGTFRCRKSNCRAKPHSRAKGTWFENARIAMVTIFKIMYMFSHNYSYEHVLRETCSDDTVLSTSTIADWFSYCRECVIVHELENQAHRARIGGPNKVVHIDGSKFGKRKCNRGRHIEGHWLIGMVEDGSEELRLEVCPDEEGSAEVLVPLIQKHVEEGSVIHTDFWRAFDCLPEHGYTHRKVNCGDPSDSVVEPDAQRTQSSSAPSQWRVLRRAFHRDQARIDFADWLVVHSWRRKVKMSHRDPFEELLTAVKHVYPA